MCPVFRVRGEFGLSSLTCGPCCHYFEYVGGDDRASELNGKAEFSLTGTSMHICSQAHARNILRLSARKCLRMYHGPVSSYRVEQSQRSSQI